jgi:chorismate mutase
MGRFAAAYSAFTLRFKDTKARWQPVAVLATLAVSVSLKRCVSYLMLNAGSGMAI